MKFAERLKSKLDKIALAWLKKRKLFDNDAPAPDVVFRRARSTFQIKWSGKTESPYPPYDVQLRRALIDAKVFHDLGLKLYAENAFEFVDKKIDDRTREITMTLLYVEPLKKISR